MKSARINLKYNLKFWTKTIYSATRATLLVVMICGITSAAFSRQPAFIGDYDRVFASPNGYAVDALPPDPTLPSSFTTQSTSLFTGELLPDGSIIAGGRLVYRNASNNPSGDFWVRKYLPSGAPDTSFGTNGYVRTNFYTGFDANNPSNELPDVLKVQPDGKIVFAGQCTMVNPDQPTPAFGVDICLVRYNANGTLDASFGGGTLSYNGANTGSNYSHVVDAGKVIVQTGTFADGLRRGTDGYAYDMAVQPDGKIIVVGETRYFNNFFNSRGYGAIIIRLNPNGSLDTTFGTNGIVRWTAPENPANCLPTRRFLGVRLQPDGRIIAVGHDGAANASCAMGEFFVVTRWSAAGQLETVRRLDNNTDVGQKERAVSAHLTRDGSKILVSGSYRNLSGTPAGRNKMTMVRLNLSDLSLDTSFGNGGIVQHNIVSGAAGGSTLYLSAIQPDGRIIGVDDSFNTGRTVRFNPDGSSDQSFGNQSFDGSFNGTSGLPRGRLYVTAAFPSCGTPELSTGHVLVRPNGRINLIGTVNCSQFVGPLGGVSQQFTVWENGVYADFENDGRNNIAVFRSGNWFWLDSTTNQFRAAQFGISSDKLAPADFDGDGRTDLAVFRDGNWYYIQSSTNQFRSVFFGQAGDVLRPGDFDGDGRADIAVFRPSSGTWYWLESSSGQFRAVQFGAGGDAPLLADFDADGKRDIAVFRQGVWYWLSSSTNQFNTVQFGQTGDIPVVGDYDADSRSDVAVFRPSNGTWYRLNSSNNQFVAVQFGANGDRAVPGDYDNDGRTDLAVYRAGNWFVLRSRDNSFSSTNFGIASDTPIPSAYLP